MDIQRLGLFIAMGIMVIGAGFIVFLFVKSVLAKRSYEREVLPDVYGSDVEEEILPDVEESGFSALGESFGSEEESASDIYHEIYDNRSSDRRSK